MEAGIVTFDGYGNENWQWVAGTVAGFDGTYTLTVPPGTNYTVDAWGPWGTDWLDQYYNLMPDLQNATLLLPSPTRRSPASTST